MPSVPEQLQHAREKKNLSVEEVADLTKMRADHVRALENGEYAVFPAPVYVRGFVKNYASLLHLDVPQIINQLDEELGLKSAPQESTSPTGPRQGVLDSLMLYFSKVNWQTGLWIGGSIVLLLALFLVYRTWRQYATHDPLSELGPGMYQSTNTNSGELLPLGDQPPR